MAGPLNADTFRVERSIVIEAPPEAIFPHIDDFHAWADWSPYEKMDANLAKTFTGPPKGKGATYAWVGKTAGSGSMAARRPPDRIKPRRASAVRNSSRACIKRDCTVPFGQLSSRAASALVLPSR